MEVNEKNAFFLAENCDIITISLDSPHENINDASRGVKGTFKKSTKSLKLLREANPNIYLRIHCVISSLNLNHLNDFIPFIKEFSINEIGGGVMNPFIFVPGNFKISEKDDLNKKILEFGLLAKNEGIKLAGCFNQISKNKIFNIETMLFSEKETAPPYITCLGLWSRIAVRPNGDVSICCFTFKPVLGNIKEMPFEEIWNSARANNLREYVRAGHYLDKPCKGCDLGHPSLTKIIKKTGNMKIINDIVISSR